MFLFSFTKDQKISYLLGTYHDLKFEELPEKAKALILSQEVAVLEVCSKGTIEEREIEYRKNGYFKVEGEEVVISNITKENQEMILDFIDLKLRQKGYKFSSRDLNKSGVAYLGFGAIQVEGMDSFIEEEFTKAHKKLCELDKVELRTASEAPKIFPVEEALSYIGSQIPLIMNNMVTAEDNYLNFCYSNSLVSRIFFSLSEKILDERNEDWIPKIEKYHQDFDNVIFCVGAAHLFGANGLIRLLAQQGYVFYKMEDSGDFASFTLAELEKMEKEAPYNDFKFYHHSLTAISKEELKEIIEVAKDKEDQEIIKTIEQFENTILHPESDHMIINISGGVMEINS